MRHRKARNKLNRTSTHRRAMYANMLLGLIEHGRIKTTERRARDIRRVAERLVTRATRLKDVLLKDPEKLDSDESAKMLHAMRMARRLLKDRQAVAKVFEDWAPRYLGRPGGYTRISKIGYRRGDNAPMAVLEFIEAEMPDREGRGGDEGGEPKKKKGLLGRLRRKKN